MARVPSFSKLTSTPGRVSVQVGTFAIAVALERRRIARGSPRRVKRVDARTGADPSLQQTVILLAAPLAIRRLIGVALPGPDAKLQRQQEELQRELERVRAEHPDDPLARQEAIVRLHRERGPMQASCLPVLARAAPALLIERCPVPLLAQRRTLADLLAGTRIVCDRHSRRTGLRWRPRTHLRRAR